MYDIINTLQTYREKYDVLITRSVYAFTGWFLSWVLFFIMLPFMLSYFGKVKGVSLNYGFSWVSMIAIILALEFRIEIRTKINMFLGHIFHTLSK